MNNGRSNVLRDKADAFALRIVNLHKYVKKKYHESVISIQLLRCGTSIGANIREGEYSESKADFIHKNRIALKESNEAQYWINLLYKGKYLTEVEYESIMADNVELIKLLTASIKTASKSQELSVH